MTVNVKTTVLKTLIRHVSTAESEMRQQSEPDMSDVRKMPVRFIKMQTEDADFDGTIYTVETTVTITKKETA